MYKCVLASCNICTPFTAELQVGQLQSQMRQQARALIRERREHEREKEAAEQELHHIKANPQKGFCIFLITFISSNSLLLMLV